MIVDLFTHSKEIQDIIIKDYPEKIFPDKQYYEDTSLNQEPKLYCFYELELEFLQPLLDEKCIQYEYEIRDSETGDILDVNFPFPRIWQP